ncbi:MULTISPECIES: aromatic ring-hydroxylating dioxygenase subunit alpha [Zoogloea]|jgi:phenylpropionate dioxygenase-like ring-hydroxylating dioxygenase large terminal subunit|uniref:Aromatic ring-hydroxylating dioxygenase subunit alpha n=1 Tax=Zoogloea oleivorans TaxID=1552750 RepID=A0A6C2CKW5_9RHOO|nr:MULTISPECIES: aromatic ring-hydroxylating dioxygenase subunit alpha [Zoogloea]MDD2668527.1 aromatic ring-hydroxylating dioxygenase subunit alpha [Zoogloea sp.]MDY0035938.1 aromatic ring-hydroxylating dioxygenase subunit alpha [Zoogloea oleivorans]TYC54767.1 aromatic ring-hydroxylating dioxygenase subunit alpha [Zoogloea oleivorans]
MSDAASQAILAPAISQLPVSWYFDEKIFELEKRLLFDAGPGYVGHELMVPEANQYRSLEWLDHSRLLINRDDACYQMSNVCRHRQAIMLEGSGVANSNIVCPVHRWTYNPDGLLIGAPHFSENPCLNLQRQKLENWHGLQFKGPRSANADLAGMQVASELDFAGYKLDKVEIHECNYNWKTFIEVYLEDYHVEPYHPGLGKFVTCDDLTWQFGEWYSVQRVGITSLQKPGSPTYKRWHEAVMSYHGGEMPKHGAIWLTYFPNIMVEWYPHVLVVSSLIPTDVNKTTNVVEFYYPEDILEFERDFVEAEQAAYMETAIEDDDIGERMDRGRLALMKEGRNEVGPYQSPYEDGMQHFHEFYRRIMQPHF